MLGVRKKALTPSTYHPAPFPTLLVPFSCQILQPRQPLPHFPNLGLDLRIRVLPKIDEREVVRGGALIVARQSSGPDIDEDVG